MHKLTGRILSMIMAVTLTVTALPATAWGSEHEMKESDIEISNETETEQEDEEVGLEETDLDEADIEEIGPEETDEIVDLEEVDLEAAADIISGKVDNNNDGEPDVTWRIDANGKLWVDGTGNVGCPWWKLDTDVKYTDKIKTAEIHLSGATDLSNLFLYCENMTSVDLRGLDTSNAIDMENMFYGCKALKSADLSGFDTAKVKYMEGMFHNCRSLETVKIASFDTGNVTTMKNLFNGCASLKEADVSGFHTENVESFDGMFRSCENLSIIDVSGFRTPKATNMGHMFADCKAVHTLDVSQFDTSSVTYMGGMFYNCEQVSTLNVSGFNTENVTDLSDMFYGCENVTELDVSGFNTSRATKMDNMFAECKKVTSLDVSGFNTGKVRNYGSMFWYCENLQSLDLSSFKILDTASASYMLTHCNALTKIIAPKNISQSIELPTKSGDTWYTSDGSTHTKLPTGIDYKCVLQKNSVPEDDIMNQVWGDITWSLVEGVLSISGSGQIPTAIASEDVAWYQYRNRIRKVVIEDGVQGIGAYAFHDCEYLRSVTIPPSMKFIETNAFFQYDLDSMDGLLILYMGTESEWKFISIGDDIRSDIEMGFYSLVYINGGSVRAKLENGSVDLTLSAADFERASSRYNHNLSRLSMGLSTVVYNEKNDRKYIARTFRGLGFNTEEDDSTFVKNHFYPDETTISTQNGKNGLYAPVWIAHRPINAGDGTDCTLVCVAIRGTSKTEWIDNFDCGNGMYHVGFDRAAQRAVDQLNEYIAKHRIAESGVPVKVLITGHSRGAGVANLMAMRLNRLAGEAGTEYLNKDDIYAYTYATPNVTMDADRGTSDYNNIHNILNPEDFVTKVMPVAWGYGRYGLSYVLPDRSTSWVGGTYYEDRFQYGDSNLNTYDNYLKDVQKNFDQYTSKLATYEPYRGGMQPVTDYVSRMTKSVGTVKDYYEKPLLNEKTSLIKSARTGQNFHPFSMFNLYTSTLGYLESMGDYSDKGFKNFKNALAGGWGSLGFDTAKFFIVHQGTDSLQEIPFAEFFVKSEFEWAHTPETYLAMVNTVSENCLLKNKIYKGVQINCPVDVVVKDHAGTVVAEIIDNQVANVPAEVSSGVSAGVVGESKTIYFPAGEEYSLEITGYDAGTMDCSVIEYDPDLGEVSRKIYLDLPVATGESYTQNIASENSLADICLYDSDHQQVTEDGILTGDEIGTLTLSITTTGYGSVESTGMENLTIGDYVTLTATADEYNSFLGWYDTEGNLLSEDLEYSFSIKNDMAVEGRFTDIPKGLWIQDVPDMTYAGSAVTPSVEVYLGDQLLTKGVDYTLSYRNNVKVNDGTNAATAPTVVVTGKGNYTKSATATFRIIPKNIGDGANPSEELIVSIADKAYTGAEVKSKPTIKWGKITLREGTDYELSYPSEVTKAGDVIVTVTGKGNYSGGFTAQYKIYDKAKDFSKLYFAPIPDQIYTGSPLTPEVVVKPSKTAADDEALVPNVDYEVIYDASTNVNAGAGSLTVVGIGDYEQHGNIKKLSFKIKPKTMNSENLGIDYEIPVYTGSGLKPVVTVVDLDAGTVIPADCYSVTYSNNVNVPAAGVSDKKRPTIKIAGKKNYAGSVTIPLTIQPKALVIGDVPVDDLRVTIPDIKDSAKGVTEQNVKPVIQYGKKTLTKGRDYTVSFLRVENQQLQTAEISFIGNYSGTMSKTFSIYGSATPVSSLTIMVEDEEGRQNENMVFTYTGGKIVPHVTVTTTIDGNNHTLVEGKDYKVVCANNVNAALPTAKKAPNVKITGMGAYSGSSQVIPFTISPKLLTADDILVTTTDVKFSGKPVKSKVSVLDASTGKALSSSLYTIDYENNTQISDTDAKILIKGKGNYYTEEPLKYGFRIYRTDISKMYVDAISSVTYTGKQIRPASDLIRLYTGKAKTADLKLKEGEDYLIRYDENIRAGVGRVIIDGIGEYGGTKIITFTILPKWLQWILR